MPAGRAPRCTPTGACHAAARPVTAADGPCVRLARVRSENTPFEGGPLDGRVLPVLVGPTGHPPKWYKVPVPNDDGTPPTVYAYRRVPSGYTKRLGLQRGWKYEYAPGGVERRTLKWPWSKPNGAP